MDLLWYLNQNVGVIDCIYHFDANLIWKKTIRLKKKISNYCRIYDYYFPSHFKHEDLVQWPDFLSDL